MHEPTQVNRAVPGEREGWAPTPPAIGCRTLRFERVVPAARHDAFAAILGAIDRLGYPRVAVDADACVVRFAALAGTVTAGALDASPGASRVRVEIRSLGGRASGGSAVVILPGLLMGAAMRLGERYFARGFLDNVARVLDGRAVGRDSARLPLLAVLRERLEIGAE